MSMIASKWDGSGIFPTVRAILGYARNFLLILRAPFLPAKIAHESARLPVVDSGDFG